MNHRAFAATLLLISLAGILLGYFLMNPELIRLCPSQLKYNCLSESWNYGVGYPLYMGIYLLPPFFLALIFVRKEVFWAWIKFIPWFALPGIAFVISAAPLGTSVLDWDRTVVTELVVRILVGISVLFIAWKYWSLDRKVRT